MLPKCPEVGPRAEVFLLGAKINPKDDININLNSVCGEDVPLQRMQDFLKLLSSLKSEEKSTFSPS